MCLQFYNCSDVQKENTGQFLFNIWVTWYWVLWGTLKIRECPQRDVIKSIHTAGSYLAYCEHREWFKLCKFKANWSFCIFGEHCAYMVNTLHILWTLCIYGEHYAHMANILQITNIWLIAVQCAEWDVWMQRSNKVQAEAWPPRQDHLSKQASAVGIEKKNKKTANNIHTGSTITFG